MKTVYVELMLGHKSFTGGKIAIVAVQTEKDCEHIRTYANIAKKKVCKEFGLNEEEIRIFDWSFLGEDVVFI